MVYRVTAQTVAPLTVIKLLADLNGIDASDPDDLTMVPVSLIHALTRNEDVCP